MEATLPHRDEDAVMTLYVHCFLSADLMLKNYKKLSARWDKDGRISKSRYIDFRIYVTTWLGYLAVTAEGFKKLGMRRLLEGSRPNEFEDVIEQANTVGRMLKEHDDALRKFRNNIFHLRDDSNEVMRFFYEKPGRLAWAEELHSAFRKFFSGYRVSFFVHCLRNQRSDEASHFVRSVGPICGPVWGTDDRAERVWQSGLDTSKT